jgi:hypothetical protein
MPLFIAEENSMRKQASSLEWSIVENDGDWARISAPPLPDVTPVTIRRLRLKRYFWGVVALLLLLASAGGWRWHTERATFPPPAASVTVTTQPALGAIASGRDAVVVSLPSNQWEVAWWRQFGQAYSGRSPALQPDEPDAYMDVTLQMVEFAHDRAVARVIMATSGGPAYRQTRFYRHTSAGWLRTARDATLWGSARSLETPFLVYHFRQNDAPAVNAILAQIDALYNTMRRNVGLPLTPGAEKLIIEVSVTQSPGNARYQPHNDERSMMAYRLVVASPALYLAPVELTDADLLAQSIALPLFDLVLAQASDHHATGASWQPMVNGLRLWQVWDLDLPLAVWREKVVKWVYVEGPAVRPEQPFVLPDSYPALCAAHKLWLPSPTQLNLPFLCGRAEPEWEALSLPRWRLRDPLTRLDQFIAPLRPEDNEEWPGSSHRVLHPGQTVAFATLIEYAVAAYGRERLPALVAGLGRYNTWDTLLPAVFGVSPDEFEAGWQDYLAAHYGRQPDLNQRQGSDG